MRNEDSSERLRVMRAGVNTAPAERATDDHSTNRECGKVRRVVGQATVYVLIERAEKRRRLRARDGFQMEEERNSKQSFEEFSSISTASTSTLNCPPATDNSSFNMTSTSSASVPPPAASTTPEQPHSTTEDDVFFGRTTRLMWKAQTEAAASHQEPKWDDPDTEYTPPVKKSKKHRETGEVALLREPSSTTTSIKKKKEKAPSVSKTPKPPKSSRNYSVEPTSTTPRASQPKATAPPPNHATLCQPKIEEPSEPDQSLAHPHLDAKTLSAIHTIREAASSSTPTQAAAIQDAINSVLSQPEQSPAEPQTNSTVSQPPPPAPAMQFGGTASATSSLPAPIAVYPPAAPIVAPPPPPPPISQNVIPPSAELATEQRHTFMIPPTDPMYDMIVTFYFGFKGVSNQAKTGDIELINQLRADIENEKAKKNELTESITSTTGQIDDLLASGVGILKNRLDDLGMPGVSDVTELLAGSKHIVTQHKTLTTMVAQLQNAVAIEEQKLAMLGGPDAVKCFDDALIANNMDINKLSEIMISSRPSNFVAQILPDDIGIASDSKVSPSSRRPRQNKPRQNAASGGKRGGAFSGRKTEGFNEDEELEIQQFVQHALKVDNAVKEKERKARGNSLVAAERVARKDFTGAAPPPATSNSLLHH
uniref:Uncharacterized protein n=3 Tax=Caenorhabditis japonica TaxID=281687 RepID=A0A8R1HPM5_CAEJA